jgi:hypothetical protein
MGLLRGVVAGGATAAIVGKRSAQKQFNQMQAAQAQQAQLNQAQAAAAQAQQAAQAKMAQQQQAIPSQPAKDPVQELQTLGNLKQQGLITEEEYQNLKAKLLSNV